MNFRAKEHLESHKKVTGDQLAARVSTLKEKGLANDAIQRDSIIKKMKARIRQTNYRLSRIAAQEKLNADKAKAKADKLAEKKKSPDKPPAKTGKGGPEKKEKKEKKKKQSPAPDEQVKEYKEQPLDKEHPLDKEQPLEKEHSLEKEQPLASDEEEKKEKSPPSDKQE